MSHFQLDERIARIEAELRAINKQVIITQWELNFLESMKKLRFGSDLQLQTLARIEQKVFGTQPKL